MKNGALAPGNSMWKGLSSYDTDDFIADRLILLPINFIIGVTVHGIWDVLLP